jgi:hypothetical protein
MVQFLSIIFFISTIFLGFSKVSVFCVTLYLCTAKFNVRFNSCGECLDITESK